MREAAGKPAKRNRPTPTGPTGLSPALCPEPVQFESTCRRRNFFAGVPGVRVNEMVLVLFT